MKKTLVKIGALATAAAPFMLFAQSRALDNPDLTPIETLINGVDQITVTLVPIMMTLALIYFIYGLIKYIIAAGKGAADEQKQGKTIMIWGIVALFVMASVWGLTGMLGKIFGVGKGNAPSAEDLTPSGYDQ